MDRSSILRASTISNRQVDIRIYLLFLFLVRTAENRTLCRARVLNKRGAFVASGRGRRQAAEAGAYLRSKYADSPRKLRLKTDAMFIESQLAMRRISGSPPAPRRIELCAGRGRKENAAATQGGMRFPDGSPGGKRVPEFALRPGRAFPTAAHDRCGAVNLGRGFFSYPLTADESSGAGITISRHIGVAKKAPSQIDCSGGWLDRPAPSTPKPARSPSQNWVEESQNAIAGGQYDCRR